MATKQVDAVVVQNLNETKPGHDDHRTRVARYDQAYAIWRALPPKGAAAASWASRVRVPFAMHVLETALVNVSTGKPRCKVSSRTPDWELNEEAFQRAFDYYTDHDHLAEKEPLVVQQGLIYGACAGVNHWQERKGSRVVHYRDDDTHEIVVRQEPASTYVGPSFEPWDIYHVWWDPNGRDVDSCQYVVLQSYQTKDYLLRNACTVHDTLPNMDKAYGGERDRCDGIYHNVQDLLETGAASRPNQSQQDRFLGAQDTARKGQYQLWEIWRDERVTVIGNKKVLLRDEPNPHWHGKKPVVIAHTRPDGFKVQGVPETELIDHIQQALWTNMNLRQENEHLTVWRGFTYREGGIADPDQIQIKPRALIGVADHDDLRPIDVQPLPAEAYREEESLLGLMQLVTGITPYVSGGSSVGADQNTATGVSLLSSAASRLLQFKGARIRTNIWQRTYEQWGSCIQQYMEDPLWVRLTGEQGWQQITQEHVAGEFDFQVDPADDAAMQQQQRADAIALLNAVAPFVQLGIINAKALLEKTAEAFGIENPDTLFQQAPQQPQAAPVGQNGGQPPPQGGAPGQGQNLQLDPRVVQQMMPQGQQGYGQ